MPALKPEVNIPVEIALKYQGGKDVVSQIDGKPQVMFTLTSGDQLYVSPTVAAQIDALGVVPGEPFGLVKRERRSGVKRFTEFEVYRLDAATNASEPAPPRPGMPAPRATPPPPPQQQPAPRAPQPAAQMLDQGPPVNWDDIPGDMLEQQLAASIEQAHAQKALAPSNVTAMPARRETSVRSAAPAVTNAFSLVAQVLGNALISAFDAAQMLEAYAASKGVEMRMEAEQIKCMAVSIFIDLQKNGMRQQQQPLPATVPVQTAPAQVSRYRQ